MSIVTTSGAFSNSEIQFAGASISDERGTVLLWETTKRSGRTIMFGDYSIGDLGSIGGIFHIGSITDHGNGLLTAPVTGAGTITVHDGVGFVNGLHVKKKNHPSAVAP